MNRGMATVSGDTGLPSASTLTSSEPAPASINGSAARGDRESGFRCSEVALASAVGTWTAAAAAAAEAGAVEGGGAELEGMVWQS